MVVNLYAVKFVVLYIGLGKIFCRQKKNGWSQFIMAQPSFFYIIYRELLCTYNI